MEAANVTATERLLDAAIAAGVGRIVHVSTVNAFGDTGYRVVDETYERPQPYRYVSFYDETKHRAHLLAHERIAAGAPVLIAMPGGVYGPGDHSSLGGVLGQAAEGRLRALTFGDLGLNMAHVEDIAGGIALVGERGVIGEAYVLGGEITTLAELVRRVSAIAGHRPPRLSTPTWMLRAAAPLVRRIGPDLRELVSASARRHVLGHRCEGAARARLRPAGPRVRAGRGLRPVVDADVPEADAVSAGRREPGGGKAALDPSQVVDVAAATTLPSVPRKLREPQRPVHEAAPASRLRHGDRDPFSRQVDRSRDEAVDVGVAADHAVEDDPVVRVGLGSRPRCRPRRR